jgi:hypothetical protein
MQGAFHFAESRLGRPMGCCIPPGKRSDMECASPLLVMECQTCIPSTSMIKSITFHRSYSMTQSQRTSRIKKSERVRKERRSFTLSRESIALLTELCATGNSSKRRSASAVLDSLLRSLKKERKRKAVEQAITSYYSGLPEQARDEDKEWGEFSLAQFSEGTK